MFEQVFMEQVNPILANFWRTLPEGLLDEAINSLKIWSENPQIEFAFLRGEPEAPCVGVLVDITGGVEEIVDWRELEGFGLAFALNYKIFMPANHRLVIDYKTGVSGGFQVNEHEGWSYSPEEVNAGIQQLRRWGFQIPGLTA